MYSDIHRPAYVCQACQGMAQHFHVWLAAVAAPHELQESFDAFTVDHQLTTSLAVPSAKLYGGHSRNNLHCIEHIFISTWYSSGNGEQQTFNQVRFMFSGLQTVQTHRTWPAQATLLEHQPTYWSDKCHSRLPTCEHCLLAKSTSKASLVRTPMVRRGGADTATAMRRRASLLARPQPFLTL